MCVCTLCYLLTCGHGAPDVAVEALHAAGAEGLLRSFGGGSSSASEVEKQTSFLLQKLEDRKVKLTD